MAMGAHDNTLYHAHDLKGKLMIHSAFIQEQVLNSEHFLIKGSG